MKDPLDHKQRAHEILGVTLHATAADIQKAYALRSRESREGRVHLTQAMQRLRRAETRLEEELWHYDEPSAGEGGQSECCQPAVVLPPLEIDVRASDLGVDRWRADLRPISTTAEPLEHLEQYDSAITYPPLSFDR